MNNRPPELIRTRTAGTRGGEIRVRLTALPKTLNPLLIADEPSLLVNLYMLHARLVDFNHDTHSWEGALAEQWQTAPSGETMSVRLREGLKFSDGQALTSADVLFSLQAVYDQKTNSPLLRDALLIGGKPITASATDARTLRLIFPAKVAAPESYLSNLPILPRHLLATSLQQGTLNEMWGIDKPLDQIVTAGPFIPTTVEQGAALKLKRNPHYWKQDQQGTSLPYLDGVTLEAISDANNTMLRLTQGTLEIADRIRASDFASLQSSVGAVHSYDVGPGLSTDYFWFNLNAGKGNAIKQKWFADQRFRQALARAVDRDAIAQTTLRSLATPLYGFVSPGNRTWLAKDLPAIRFDLNQAKSLLQEAGFVFRGTELWDAAGNRVEFSLLVQTENDLRKQMAAVLQQDFAKLGINLQVAPLETQAIMERWQKSFDYDAILMGLTVTDPEPSSYNNFLQSTSASHQWAPQQKTPTTDWEKQIDELVSAQSRESNAAQRQTQFFTIQRVMAEQMPIIPIVARHIVVGAHQHLGNYRPSNIFPFSCWNIDELFLRPS
ncbi:MAG TPA: ABC transporter substrate-binding protein [Blastocatellia bacterium]|nr:ABC transporter substrate-binding protein [Blastocatellia bacterium]